MMGRLISAAAAALCCAALAGCGDDAGAKPKPPAGAAPILFVKSGGIAPVYERLRIGRDGRAVLRVGQPGDVEERSFSVGKRKAAGLRAGLARAGFAGLETEYATECADCFLYGIAYRGHTVERAQIDVPPKLEPVIASLLRIIEAHRP